jgi:hypothetical protein
MRYIHALEYDSATKRNEVWRHTTICLNLENIILKEAKYRKPHIVYEMSRIGISTGKES